MPDFSGASLKLKAEGEDKILATMDRIDKKARETVGGFGRLTQSEVDKAAAAFDQLYGKQSKASRQTQQVVEEVATKVDAATNRSATGTLAISRGLEMMARTGKETGRSLDTLLANVSQMAFGFGGSGALVGAIAIGTAAIVELFARTSREMDKLTAEYAADTEKMVRSTSLMGVDVRRGELRNGQFSIRNSQGHEGETDAAFLARSQGILGLQAEQVRVQKELTDEQKKQPEDAFTRAVHTQALHTYETQLKEIVGFLKVMQDEYDALTKRETTLSAIAVERTNQEFKRKQEQKDLRADSRSVAGYENEELNKIVARAKASGDLTIALINEHNDVVALRNEQALLRYELDSGTISVKERIAKEQELARVTKELQQVSGTNIFMNGVNVRVNPKAADLSAANDSDKQQVDAIKKSGEKMKAEAERVANEIGRTLAHGITDGIKTWFSGGSFTDGFKVLTASILDGLGQMFAEVAEKALIGSTIMQRVISAIQSMNPWVAAVAAGALLAFGNSLRNSSGHGSSGSGYSGGGGSLGAISTIGTITPQAPTGNVTNPSHITPRASTTNQIVVIGKDAKAWREVQEQLDQNARRG